MRQLMLSTRSKMRQSKEKIIKKIWKNQQKQNNCILIATFWPEHYTVEGEKLSDRSDFWSIFSSILLCTKANLSTLSAIFHQKWLINGRKRECFKIEWKIYKLLSLTFFQASFENFGKMAFEFEARISCLKMKSWTCQVWIGIGEM